MPNYLPGMLEVPVIDGQSEDICNNDDRYYHFGLWTDFCDISINQMRQYNTFPNKPGDDGYPYGPSEGTDIITYDVTGTIIAFEAKEKVESYITFTISYDYTDTDGSVKHASVKTEMKKWATGAEVEIKLPYGVAKYDITKVEMTPERDAWYYYELKRRKPDVDIDRAFRFGLISYIAGDDEVLTDEYLAKMVEGDFHSGTSITMQISIGNTSGLDDDIDRDVEFKTYEELIPIDGLNGMEEIVADRAITESAVDIVFAVDTDIKAWLIKDEFGNDIYMFERIYDYQTILEFKKFNATGNFDRVSALILMGIYWKSVDIEKLKQLANRQKIDIENDPNDFWNRPWY